MSGDNFLVILNGVLLLQSEQACDVPPKSCNYRATTTLMNTSGIRKLRF